MMDNRENVAEKPDLTIIKKTVTRQARMKERRREGQDEETGKDA